MPRVAGRFWHEAQDDLLSRLDSSPAGLTHEQALDRLRRFGPNAAAKRSRWAAFVQLAAFLFNPLVLILMLASIISGVLGDVTNASIIAGIVVVSVAINFFQDYRSQRAAERLRNLVQSEASVLRDAAWLEVPLAQVVPGDIVRLSAGDLVPADCRVLEQRDVTVNQAALTGESFPAGKQAGPLPADATASLDAAENAVFMGTSVVSGSATCVVVHTGGATELGAIGQRLRGRPAETEFERGTRRYGILITRAVIFLVVFVFLVNALAHRNPLESFLFAVALAVGLTPEFLPMIVSVTLAQGALRMARKNVIVKHLPAIENFGSMDVLCTDKTGTITAGEIHVAASLDWRGEPDPYPLRLAYLNSSLETGVKSALDHAIGEAMPQDLPNMDKLDELPFDFVRRRLSVVLDDGQENALLITKGAPESVLPLCSHVATPDGEAPFDAAQRSTAEAAFEALSAGGFRLLAVASRRIARRGEYSKEDESDLTLDGFVSFMDPPRDDVAETLAALHADGVAVKILSGDNELVAKHVCQQVGLDASGVVLGDDLDAISDDALGPIAERTTLFARVSPDQKNRVILALKRRGHGVGFIGDGINDAPSLRTADVGISVAGAVDVAKEAADIILLEHSLGVLHDGVIEGRKSFANIMKYVLMGTSSNFGNMFSMAAGCLFLPFLPMLPAQILLNNLLYTLSQATIPSDNVDQEYLVKPRRWNTSFIQLFMVVLGPISSLYDFLTFFVLLRLRPSSDVLFHTGWFVESLATQTLVIFVIRTAGNPFRSRPSRSLLLGVLVAVVAGLALPYLPWASNLGFAPPPPAFYIFLVAVVVVYLAQVQLVKPWFYRHASL
ncbi:MAG TPA: magnesium-translocating P-type ATPase [Chloroflexota bacterium]|nr:magnesium-translocating P-type ATPase [Chloroflexota bacterium]